MKQAGYSPIGEPKSGTAERTRVVLKWTLAAVALAAVVMFAYGFLTALGRIEQDNRANKSVLDQLDANQADRTAQMRKQVDQGPGEVNTGFIDDAVEDLRAAADRSTGQQKIEMDAAARSTEPMQTAAKAYAAAHASFAEAGGMDPATFKSKTDIRKRIALIEAINTAGDAIGTAVFAAPDVYEKELLAHGYDAKRAAASKRGFANGMNLPAQRKIRRADRASFEAGIRQLRLLEREWGKWKYDNAQQAVTFEKGAVADEFNQTNDEINKAAADLQAAQREAIKQ